MSEGNRPHVFNLADLAVNSKALDGERDDRFYSTVPYANRHKPHLTRIILYDNLSVNFTKKRKIDANAINI